VFVKKLRQLRGKRILLAAGPMRSGLRVKRLVGALKALEPAALKVAAFVWCSARHKTSFEQGGLYTPDYHAFVTGRLDYDLPWTFEE
jgi:hypothetical protein